MKIFNTLTSGTLILVLSAWLFGCKQKAPSTQVGTTDSIQNQPVQNISAQSKKTVIETEQKFGPYSPSDPEYALEYFIEHYKKGLIREGLFKKSINMLITEYSETDEYKENFESKTKPMCASRSDKENCKEELLGKLNQELYDLVLAIIFSSLESNLINPNPIQKIYVKEYLEPTIAIVTVEMKTGLKFDFSVFQWIVDKENGKTTGKYEHILLIANPKENIFKWIIPCLQKGGIKGCYPDYIKAIYGENANTDINKLFELLEHSENR